MLVTVTHFIIKPLNMEVFFRQPLKRLKTALKAVKEWVDCLKAIAWLLEAVVTLFSYLKNSGWVFKTLKVLTRLSVTIALALFESCI